MDHRQEIYLSIINEYRDKIIRLCLAHLDDHSYIDDIFQEVLLSIWSGLERFNHEASYGTWIYRITVNTIFLFNKNERKRKVRSLSGNFISTTISDFEQKLQEEENLRIMYKAISNLDSPDRMLIALYLEKLSYQEIGSVLGISANHVGVRLNRIKEKIRKQLNKQ